MKLMTLLLLTIHATHPQEIRLETLADGPGLLPYKLGPTRLTIHYHSFIQPIDLNDIENKIDSVQTQLNTFRTKLDNETYLLYEYQIDYLTNKVGKLLHQIKSLEPVRVKRGLIDGLGSIVKSVTGNLDYQDALKYDEALKTLQTNEGKLTSEFNSHLSLCKEWMSQHNKVLEQLTLNQIRVNATLELLLQKEAYRDYSLIKFAKFAQILGIITNNVEDLMLEIIRLENMMAFIRASSTHHSMIDIEALQSMIDRLKSLYTPNQILNLELREYYSLIKPGSYFIDKRIVIVYNFPIVSQDTYDLYKLSIVPNKRQLALIPSSPYIATDEKSFVYIEAECPKYSSTYLCEKKTGQQIQSKPDCIQKLIVHQSLENTCQFTKISLIKEAVEKLDDQHYVLSLPEPTKVQLACGRKDFNTLQGSYLVTIPMGCYLQTPELTIINDDNAIKGQPLKLAKIPYDEMNLTAVSTHINFSSIDLEDLHSIQTKFMLGKPIDIEEIQPTALYHTTIPLYVILLGAILFFTLRLIRKYKCWRLKSEDKEKQSSLEIHTYEDVKKNTRKRDDFPATFSLNMVKNSC
ncbi:uncharacterized protein LOC113506565 [Trichoplusia ni]|uniref:Uncharacterized protein LOC113506062 n=2 Tax=root TaxID=1 RepID=A0A7E5WX24_TRINI|nr:uncharacterized protein LOC113506062 [Trichoplusia ni]XP_026745206.1 uncharacterized protein LOC113506565 [Trichoplusia ni]